jgi:hypothetical protein
MRDAGIGRLLVASLHQSIADLLPMRLEFYENWFNPVGLREGTIGLAPLAAVLSFLRREDGMYGDVTARAGNYAGEWTVMGMSGLTNAAARWLPHRLRARVALRVGRDLVRTSYAGSRAIVRVRRGVASLDIRGSIFCGVREPSSHALCGFYRAAFERVFVMLDVPAAVELVSCRGAGGGACRVVVRFAGRKTPPVPGIASNTP